MKKIKKAMRELLKTASKLMPDILALAGGCFVAAGVFMIYTPAGFIISGFLLVTAAVIWSKGGYNF
ncbi:MAG: hypothetical protein RSF33_08075 [Hydrogenoanaerobacterium sp.]